MNYDIKVGFSRVDVTPPLGAKIGGYVEWRYADGVLDNLEINTVAVEKDGKCALIMAIDNLHFPTECNISIFDAVHEATGVARDAIFVHSTHTHTSPVIDADEKLPNDEINREYTRFVTRRFVDGAKLAIADLTPSVMGYAMTKAEKIAFNRRYLMTDGTTETNPGVNNPRIASVAGALDEELGVVRFKREDGLNIVLVNFANHPDVIGGNKISADWPGFTRRIFEHAIDNTRCVVLNGAQGDINHIKVDATPAELADMIIDFDAVPRGYSHSRHIGNVLAGAVMGVYEKMNYAPVKEITYKSRGAEIPTNMPKPEDIPGANYILEMYEAGRIGELNYEGMMVTTVVAEARRMLRLENGPAVRTMALSGLRIGDVALIGIPGEPFTGIGIGMKEAEGYGLIMPMCLTNGSYGYFPMQDSYDEGGYEARSSNFRAGVAERLISECRELLGELK